MTFHRNEGGSLLAGFTQDWVSSIRSGEVGAKDSYVSLSGPGDTHSLLSSARAAVISRNGAVKKFTTTYLPLKNVFNLALLMEHP